MDTSGSKLQQKALQQPKQKKSKSAEFLMGGMEESAVVEGIENPVFDGSYSTELSASQASAGREIQRDRQDSTLAAHQQKMELRAPAKPRVSTGNERARNYFDPALVQETNPRRCGMAEVGTEDELELKIMNQDEKGLYQKMAEMLDADDDITIIELPGMALAHREEEEVWKVRAGDPTLRVGAGAAGRGRFMAAVEEGEEEVIPRYAQQLRERMLPDMITLGSLSLEQEPQAQSHRDCDQQERILQDRLYAAFQRAESQLLKALRERKGEVIAKYGEMTEASSAAESPWAREPGLGWQVEWSQSPQPMEVRVRCLRAVRDKLPRGLYSLSVALHSRLGGPALTWSCLKEEQWAGTTEPVEHGGHFYDTELHVNQSLFTILPASCDMLPSMVLLFRLLGLTGERSPVGTTLGWAAFPVCHATLTTVQGRFKTPILRGLPHPHLDQFRKIEGLMSADLDNWLCNLYFQVRKLPSGSSRRDEEHSVTLQIPPLLVPPSPPQAGPSGTSPSRGRGGIKPCHRGSPLHLSASHSSSACSSSTLPGRAPPPSPPSPPTASGHRKNSTVVVPEKIEEMRDPYTEKAETWMHYKKKPINKINSSSAHVRGSAAPPPLLQGQADKQETAAPAAASSEKRENLWAKEMEEYTFSLQPVLSYRGPGGGGTGSGSNGGAAERTHLALRMIPSELGLSPRRWGWRSSSAAAAAQLCLIMPLLALIWFARLYLHYCSQWLFLQAIAVPVNKFQFHAHTVELVYQNSLLHTREELAMVVVGPLTLNAVTLLLLLIRWGCQLAFGSLPSFTSNFIMALGVWTVLDPLAVFVVDAVLGRLSYSAESPVADAAKLYWHFYRTDQSGAAGVVITLFLYAILFLLSTTILYLYFLRLHNEGRMLDIFQRLSVTEGSFFVPRDLEVSNQELDYIIQKAEQWRGFNGERRKVSVYDYIWTEEGPLAGCAPPRGDPRGAVPAAGGESSTHVSVYTLYLSGQRHRYRHFLRQPDGAILEVIGDMDGAEPPLSTMPRPGQRTPEVNQEDEGTSSTLQLRERKRRKPVWRTHRVEPVGDSGHGSSCTARP
nr:orofacial cleft 1 candidate gene 1 protein [Oncorhynchus nerka]